MLLDYNILKNTSIYNSFTFNIKKKKILWAVDNANDNEESRMENELRLKERERERQREKR